MYLLWHFAKYFAKPYAKPFANQSHTTNGTPHARRRRCYRRAATARHRSHRACGGHACEPVVEHENGAENEHAVEHEHAGNVKNK